MSDIQEEQKRLYKKAKENDFITTIEDKFIIDDEKIKELYNGDYKKALYEVAKNERKLVLEKNILNNKINKAIEYMNNYIEVEELNEPVKIEFKEVIKMLKGDNK